MNNLKTAETIIRKNYDDDSDVFRSDGGGDNDDSGDGVGGGDDDNGDGNGGDGDVNCTYIELSIHRYECEGMLIWIFQTIFMYVRG